MPPSKLEAYKERIRSEVLSLIKEPILKKNKKKVSRISRHYIRTRSGSKPDKYFISDFRNFHFYKPAKDGWNKNFGGIAYFEMLVSPIEVLKKKITATKPQTGPLHLISDYPSGIEPSRPK